MSFRSKGTVGPTVIVSVSPDLSGNYVCNGVADEVEVNLALAEASRGGGGLVLLRTGTYTLANPIVFPGNSLVLQGVGRATFIDGDALTTTNHGIVISGYTDCVIKDLSIQTEDGGGKTCHCIFIEDGADRFKIENVWIVDSDDEGIHVEGTTINGGYISNVIIEDADGYGIGVDMDGGNFIYRLQIVACDITGAFVGIRFDPSGGNIYCIIERNIVSASGLAGINVINYRNGTISDNISYGNGRSGINIESSSEVNVAGNHCLTNAWYGIYLLSADDCLIEDNQCIENDLGDAGLYDGIYVDGGSDDNLILGNKCNDNDRYGINVAGARNRVKENDFSGNTAGAFNDGGTDTRVHEWNETVENPDSYIGHHPAEQMLDDVEVTTRIGFSCPMDFQELVTAQVVIVAAAAGNLRWDAFTDWGKICATEDYDTHSDSVGATTTAVLADDLVCIDVSTALNVAALTPGDRVGLEFWRDGDNALDTINDTVYVLLLRLRYV